MRSARPVSGRTSVRVGRGNGSPPYNADAGTPAIGDDDPESSLQIELLDDDSVTLLTDDDPSIFLSDDY